ncbi:PAS domain-containing sensor histidine kinase [Planctomycetota bacterium]
MLPFIIAGFIVGAVVVAVLAALGRKKSSGHRESLDLDKGFEELGKLTGALAHEIKNPLSTIKINLKLIHEGLADRVAEGVGLTSEIRKISVIEKEADRLEHILDDFLRYTDKTELQLADIDVNELVSDMVDFYCPQAHSNSITIRKGLSDETLICRIDADMLKQVLLNLFINARQAMKKGDELIIRTARQNDCAQIEISDTGRGIAADKLDFIFEAYYSSRSQGSGLGLATAKKIVTAHKGTITVDSEVGKGTCFKINLPLKVSV